MAVSLTQQVGNLLKRIIKSFNGKIAGILLILSNHKSAGSFGALAGFAIAIIFTWKFLRPPTGPQHNRRKSRGSESGSSTATRTDEVASFSKGSANDELVKLPLGEIVRKKLNGSRKMTCQLLGVILEESSPEELQEHATVRPSAVEVLSEISKSCDLYLMERILDDESGERALLALDNAGLFGNGGIMKDKVLFCSTESGRSSFVRQLEPEWHVDTNPEIISQLSRFIRYQLHVSPIGSSVVAPNIFSSESLQFYFTEEKVV